MRQVRQAAHAAAGRKICNPLLPAKRQKADSQLCDQPSMLHFRILFGQDMWEERDNSSWMLPLFNCRTALLKASSK